METQARHVKEPTDHQRTNYRRTSAVTLTNKTQDDYKK